MAPEQDTFSSGLQMVVTERVMNLTVCDPPDNRITPAMVVRLDEVLDEAYSESIDAIMITGEGRNFSKGFDINAVSTGQDRKALRRLLVQANSVFTRLAQFPKPVVAAIKGACLGGGLELTLACHFRLCATKSRLGLPEVWGGMVPGLGGLHRLAGLVGRAKALELVALGDLVSSEEALRLNLVNRVFSKDSFCEQVNSFIKALLTADPLVLREIIRLVRCGGTGDEDCLREGMESFARLAPWLRR